MKKEALLLTIIILLSGLVSAITLSDYPSPFLDNNKPDFTIIIGSEAAPADLLGAVDIASNLQAMAYSEQKLTGLTTYSVSDGVNLDFDTDLSYLNEYISKSSITNGDFPNMLATLTFRDDNDVEIDYSQSISLGTDTKFTFDQPNDDSEADPELVFNIDSTVNGAFYTSKISFDTAINFTSSAVQGETIELFGKEYVISTETDDTNIVLYSSAVERSLSAGEETSITVADKSYEVKIIGFSKSGSINQVVINVNGDVDTINEEATKTVGGLKILVKSISTWNSEADGLVTLILGSEKYTFTNGSKVVYGDDNSDIDGTVVLFTGTIASGITDIQVQVTADDTETEDIQINKNFTDPVWNTFKFDFAGTSSPLNDENRVLFDFGIKSDKKSYLIWTDKNSNEKKVYFTYGSSLADSKNNSIHVYEGAVAAEREYLFLAAADEKPGRMLKVYKIQADTSGSGDDYASFIDVMTNETYKTPKFTFGGTDNSTGLSIGGKTYTVTINNSANGVSVTYNDGQTVVFPELEAANGAIIAFIGKVNLSVIGNNTLIYLPGEATWTVDVDKYDGQVTLDNNNSVFINYNLDNNSDMFYPTELAGANTGVIVLYESDDQSEHHSTIITTNLTSSSKVYFLDASFSHNSSNKVENKDSSNDDLKYDFDYWGLYGEYNKSDSSDAQYTYKLWYPDNQVYASIFISKLESTITSSFTGTTTDNIIEVGVGIAVLDSDYNYALGTDNLIVIGGPCVNTLAAVLMGNPDDCTAGFEEGKAVIKLYEHETGKASLLVAGYSATDTVVASRAVAYNDIQVVSASQAEIIVENMTNYEIAILP